MSILTLLIALSASPCIPTSAGVFQIDRCVEPADLVVHRLHGSIPDVSKAYRRAREACAAHPHRKFDPRKVVGCTYLFPAGAQLVSETIDVTEVEEIRGAGEHLTLWVVPKGVTAVHVRRRLRLSELTIQSESNPRSNVPYQVGIWLEGWASARNVTVRNFTHGVRIDAGVGRTPSSNANLWRLSDVTIQWSGHAGLYLDGPDSNAGLMDGGGATYSCVNAVYWDGKLPLECAAVTSDSFLGNTFLAVHTATTFDWATKKRYPHFRSTNVNARDVVVGQYAESDQMLGVMKSARSYAIGGVAKWDSAQQSTACTHGACNRLTLTNRGDVTLRLGGSAPRFVAIEVSARVPGQLIGALSIGKYDPVNQAWRQDVARLNSAAFIQVSATKEGPLGSYGALKLNWP